MTWPDFWWSVLASLIGAGVGAGIATWVAFNRQVTKRLIVLVDDDPLNDPLNISEQIPYVIPDDGGGPYDRAAARVASGGESGGKDKSNTETPPESGQ